MKKIVIYLIALPIVVVFLLITGCAILKRQTNIDRTTFDYQNRKIDFWGGNIPFKIQGEIKYTDMKFVRYLMGNENEEQVPYMVDYSLRDSSKHAAMIICPGGSYAFRSEKIEGTEIAEWLNSIGISAYVLNYRVEPYKYPVPLIDLTRAIKYLRANADKYQIDPTKIGVLGFSAGGHLASTLGTHYHVGNTNDNSIDGESEKPNVLVLCQPVITMKEYKGQTNAEKRCIMKLLGENPSDSMLTSLSNEKQVTKDTPSTFIWTTQTDNMVNPKNSQLFADSLKAKGVECELHVFPNGRHGLGLAKGKKEVGEWPSLCSKWLRKIGFY